jgi:photosystem II stability/assembly factor-like uncharacterized protein
VSYFAPEVDLSRKPRLFPSPLELVPFSEPIKSQGFRTLGIGMLSEQIRTETVLHLCTDLPHLLTGRSSVLQLLACSARAVVSEGALFPRRSQEFPRMAFSPDESPKSKDDIGELPMRIPRTLRVLFLIAAFATLGIAQTVHQPKLTPQNSGTTEGLIAVSPVNARVVWAAGRQGTFLLTTDGGKTWKSGKVAGAEWLQFRDVQGVNEKVAYLQSIGNAPSDFRIYKTEDGGATWTKQFQNQLAGAFYDCFAFWTPQRGISHSDSVNGVFPDIRTSDGTTWQSIAGNMPPALSGEASFAASGTCVATQGQNNAWIATGGSTIARILATTDGASTWNAYDTPLVSSPTAGAFTVDFRDASHGIVGGGDLDPGDPNNARTAVSADGGQTWTLTNAPPVTGAIFGLSYVREIGSCGLQCQDDLRYVVVTANSGGAAWTPDEGTTWYVLPGVTGGWAVAFATPDAGWLVGTGGQIIKISF